ncbi:DMT family transporter [Bifidobacterium choloepi]|uniref:EamA family transporter n=1 Tax=Bifidobacterium choloepi TaxID=2614131 RepID=A0A6I5N284_9BIFI|nr:EamA family transporter [Bifidobacterium choloepi]
MTGTDEDSAALAAAELAEDPSERTGRFEETPRRIMFGVVLVLVGGALWGVNGSLSKMLLDWYGVPELWLACVRQTTIGLLYILTALAGSRRSRDEMTGALRDVRSYPMYLLSALFCVLLEQVAYLFSVHWTNGGTATVLQTVNLVMVLVYVCVTGHRRPTPREIVGTILAFAGVFLIATGGNFSTLTMAPQALFWGLVNAFACACLAIMPVKLMARHGELPINGIMFLVAGLCLMPFVQPWNSVPQMDTRGWWLFAAYVILGGFFAYWLFMAGVVRVGSMRATMLGTMEPVVATITAVLWTGAVFLPTDFVGFALILIMVFLVH